MRHIRTWPVIALLAFLTACGSATPIAAPTTAPTATLLPLPSPSAMLPAPAAPSSQVPADLLQAMIADLAGRLNISADAISVQSAETVTWSDSSLGCPLPGAMYMQVLIDGYKVVLSAAETPYAYHAAVDGRFVLCEP